MLHIICPNTAIDYRIELEKFRVGEVQRSKRSNTFACGKGVNSAYCIDFLKSNGCLYAMVGEHEIEIFGNDKFNSVNSKYFPQKGETRRNTTLVDRDGFVAHIQLQGYHIEEEEADRFVSYVLGKIESGDTVIISGSLPSGFPQTGYNELVNACSHASKWLLLDTDLANLANLGSPRIDFIKPNTSELFTFMRDKTFDEFSECHKYLGSLGVRNILFTAGAEGAFWISQIDDPVMRVTTKYAGPPTTEYIGCGDAFIGALAWSLEGGKLLHDALLHAVSAGHSNLYHEGPGRIGPTYYEILKSASVTPMKYVEFEHLVRKKFTAGSGQ